MDRKKTPATQSSSGYAADDEDARLAALLFGDEAKATRPATEVPSSHAADDEDARLASFLVVDELGVTRPV